MEIDRSATRRETRDSRSSYARSTIAVAPRAQAADRRPLGQRNQQLGQAAAIAREQGGIVVANVLAQPLDAAIDGVQQRIPPEQTRGQPLHDQSMQIVPGDMGGLVGQHQSQLFERQLPRQVGRQHDDRTQQAERQRSGASGESKKRCAARNAHFLVAPGRRVARLASLWDCASERRSLARIKSPRTSKVSRAAMPPIHSASSATNRFCQLKTRPTTAKIRPTTVLCRLHQCPVPADRLAQ